jgi:hypothetical protein
MTIQSRHPQYSEFFTDWFMMRDTYRGERVIKQKDELYLPATNGMVVDGMGVNQIGRQAYEAYKKRAIFHDFVKDAVQSMIGKMHVKPPVISLPKSMEPLREKATIHGESLENLLRRINEHQLVTGRVGILADIPVNPEPGNDLPYLSLYKAEDIINWDDGTIEQLTLPRLNLLILDESEYERTTSLTWKWVSKYRALVLGTVEDNEDNGVYRSGIVLSETGETLDQTQLKAPSIRGRTLDKIPFVIINSKDLVTNPDEAPLLGLAQLALAIYRGEADYRQNLFQQSQDTLVVIGSGEDKYRVGAGATLSLPQGGDAKYVGVGANGLSEQRQSLQNDMLLASHKAGHLIDTRSREKESGDALRTRVSSQTATLTQIALTGAKGLENLLKIVAEWYGANPEEVVVSPNLDFANEGLNSRTLIELMTAKTMGAPISSETIHALMKDRGLTKLSFEEEVEKIEQEEPLDVEMDSSADTEDDTTDTDTETED